MALDWIEQAWVGFDITRLFSSRLCGMGYTPTQTPTDSTVDPYPDPMHLWVEVYL